MAKNNKISVKPYRRKIKGKLYKVKGYKRKHRRLGKKIRYREVGKFLVAHDDLGNFRGSKIQPLKKTKTKTTKKTKTRLRPSRKVKRRQRINVYKDTRKLDTDYYLGIIDYDQWINARRRLLKL